MGIMSHLFTPILVPNGGLQYLLSPLAFLKNPLLWVELASKYRVNMTGGPNFAYALVANKFNALDAPIALDLSEWKVAFCGAEPIRIATIRNFTETFQKWKFDPKSFLPVYGLAEATLIVSYTPLNLRQDPTILPVKKKIEYFLMVSRSQGLNWEKEM
jgi:acyl-CoA synthetase (AMP-forming)/AMP-acid ligase II